MLALSLRYAVALGAIVIATSLSAALPATAAATKNPIEIREWQVPYEGRPRDPFVAGPDQVWFVGQINGYLARLTPSTGEFFKRDLGEDAGPHNLIVDDSGIIWFAGNLNASRSSSDRLKCLGGSLSTCPLPRPSATVLFDLSSGSPNRPA